MAKPPHTDENLAVVLDHGGRSLGYTRDTGPAPALAALARGSAARHLVATHFYFDPEAAGLADRLAAGFAGPVTVATDGAIIPA